MPKPDLPPVFPWLVPARRTVAGITSLMDPRPFVVAGLIDAVAARLGWSIPCRLGCTAPAGTGSVKVCGESGHKSPRELSEVKSTGSRLRGRLAVDGVATAARFM